MVGPAKSIRMAKWNPKMMIPMTFRLQKADFQVAESQSQKATISQNSWMDQAVSRFCSWQRAARIHPDHARVIT
jgi:hypothetical protein